MNGVYESKENISKVVCDFPGISNKKTKSDLPIKRVMDEYGETGDVRSELCHVCGEYQEYFSFWAKWTKSYMERPHKYCRCRRQQVEAFERRQSQKQDEIKANLFNLSRLGDHFLARTFESFEQKRNLRAFLASKAYAENFDEYKSNGKTLIFEGDPGTGKTHLAGAIANFLIKTKSKKVIFGTAIDLMDILRRDQHYNYNNQTAMTTCDLLIIDDIGKGNITDWAQERLFTIINKRYERNLPIVATTKYSTIELIDRLKEIGEDVISRFRQNCTWVTMEPGDYRMTGGAK